MNYEITHTLFIKSGVKFQGFHPYPFDRDDMDPHKLELPK